LKQIGATTVWGQQVFYNELKHHHSELAEEPRVLKSGLLPQPQHARFLGKLGMMAYFVFLS
jgi:hypothetical protein